MNYLQFSLFKNGVTQFFGLSKKPAEKPMPVAVAIISQQGTYSPPDQGTKPACASTTKKTVAVPIPPLTNADNSAVWRDWIAQGGNPNSRDQEGKTLLQHAIAVSNLPLCRVLIDNGATWDEEDFTKLNDVLRNDAKLPV